jgi:Na+/proline symporter
MGLTGLDFGVIIGYLVFVTLIGLVVSKKATGSIEEYFLGGNQMPWYLLGISGMATFIDMGGTAYQGGWYFLLGSKGFWLCMEGALGLLLSFQMVYIGKWLNRSGVMTNAEWMVFRFGSDKQGESARILSAVAALAICAGFMTFFFVGSGKVLTTFLPYFNSPEPIISGVSNQNLAALLFFVLVGVYTIASGFYGVIYTDFVQAFLILFLIIFVAVKAFAVGTPEYFAKYATPDMMSLFPHNGDWSSISIPDKYAHMGGYVEKAKFIGLLIVFWFANNVFQGMATPFDTWTAQRYYAAKNEKESSMLCAFWIFLWSFRYLLLAGIGVLALGLSADIADPEKAMSMVIAEYIPIGIKGLLLAALLAAGMSTMDSTVNSAGAYFVKDVYQRFIKPDASTKHLVYISYAITFIMFLFGALFGWFVKDINSIWGWIIMGLFVGTLPPNILKWYWWRANGFSFTLGSITGLLAALAIQFDAVANLLGKLFSGLPYIGESGTIQQYIFVFGAGIAGSIIGAYVAKPTDMETLKKFYLKTKPFGFWGAVRKECDPGLVKDIKVESTRDMLLLLPTFAAHLSLFLMMSSLMWKQWRTVGICFAVFAVSVVILYKFWYKNLKEIPPHREVDLDLVSE